MCYNLQRKLLFTHNLHEMSWRTKKQQKGAFSNFMLFLWLFISLWVADPILNTNPDE